MKKQSGFTLIELLLVLAIIGIISAIAIPALLGQRARARDKAAQDNVSSVVADLIGSYDKVKEGGTTPCQHGRHHRHRGPPAGSPGLHRQQPLGHRWRRDRLQYDEYCR